MKNIERALEHLDNMLDDLKTVVDGFMKNCSRSNVDKIYTSILTPEEIERCCVRIDGEKLASDESVDIWTDLRLTDLISRVIFVNPKTIVIWSDGTVTKVTAQDEPFDEEKGILMAYNRRFFGDTYMTDLTSTINSAQVCMPNKVKRAMAEKNAKKKIIGESKKKAVKSRKSNAVKKIADKHASKK